MTLNFPDSPSTGDIYTDSTSGFQYEWNGTVWISTDPQRAANIKELDDISSGFNGSTTQFNLRVSSSAVEPVSDAQLLISVGGVMQNPTNDYTVSGSTITFTTAPSAGLTFFGVFLGQALSLNTVQDGTVEFASFKTGTAGVGIKSDGTAIGVGITQIDFVGGGNTVVSVGNTVSVYIAAGIDTTGISRFATGVTTNATNTNLTVTGITTLSDDVTFKGAAADVTWDKSTDDLIFNDNAQAKFGTGGDLSLYHDGSNSYLTNGTGALILQTGSLQIKNAAGNESLIRSTADGNAELYYDNTKRLETTSVGVNVVGNVDCDSFNNAGISTFGGAANFTSGELTAASATVSDLTNNRVVIAGTSGALEDSSNLTFDGSTLTVNGDMNVQGELTYQEVTEIDSVGFVTARKGVRVTNGGVIVTAGLSTFSDDVKLAGANYNITFDRSADDVIFDDNAKAIFGTSSDGLEIYHNGSHSRIDNNGTGNLYINAADGETGISINKNGSIDLWYDNVKTFATESNGIIVYGPEGGSADIYVYADEGDDTADKWRLQVDTSGNFKISNRSTGSWVDGLTLDGSNNVTFSGTVDATQGVIIDDSITHRNDTNTKIRFPADDTISFESGGEEHCRVLDTGNFIVGATAVEDWDGSRSHRIQVRGTSANNAGFSALITADDDNPSELVLGKSRSTGNSIVGSADDVGQIRWSANDGAGFHSIAYVKASMDGTPGSDDLPSKLTFGTSADGGTTVSERLRIDSSGRILIGTTNASGYDSRKLTVAAADGDGVIEIRTATDHAGQIAFSDGYAADATAYRGYIQYNHNDDVLYLGTNSTIALTITNSQNATFAGTVSDSKGNLRSIPNDTKTSAYTLVASDAGKCIRITTGGVTVPNSVFSEGDAVTIINQSGSDQTITAGSGFTLYNSGDGSAGNRTLGGRGMATMMFSASDAAYISGAGLS